MPREREQAVRETAYAIWEREGRPEGYNLDHWFRAEKEAITNAAVGFLRVGTGEPPSPRGPVAVRGSPGRGRTGMALKDVLVCLDE